MTIWGERSEHSSRQCLRTKCTATQERVNFNISKEFRTFKLKMVAHRRPISAMFGKGWMRLYTKWGTMANECSNVCWIFSRFILRKMVYQRWRKLPIAVLPFLINVQVKLKRPLWRGVFNVCIHTYIYHGICSPCRFEEWKNCPIYCHAKWMIFCSLPALADLQTDLKSLFLFERESLGIN